MSEIVDTVHIDKPNDEAFIRLKDGTEIYLCTAELAETLGLEKLNEIAVAALEAHFNPTRIQ